MLYLQDNSPFAAGVMEYEYRPIPPDQVNSRILLKLNVENILALAVIDTGAPYLVIAPSSASNWFLTLK